LAVSTFCSSKNVHIGFFSGWAENTIDFFFRYRQPTSCFGCSFLLNRDSPRDSVLSPRRLGQSPLPRLVFKHRFWASHTVFFFCFRPREDLFKFSLGWKAAGFGTIKSSMVFGWRNYRMRLLLFAEVTIPSTSGLLLPSHNATRSLSLQGKHTTGPRTLSLFYRIGDLRYVFECCSPRIV